MGKFEDDIKRKLNEGEMKMDPNHWAQLNDKLDAQNQYTPFERKVKDIFNDSVAAGSASSWDDMNDRLDHSNPSDFNKKAKEILTDQNVPYSGVAWENMRDQLSDQDLTSFEAGIKNKFKNNEIEYNSAHWDDMNKRLNSKKKKPVAWWLWGSAAAAFIIGGIGVGYFNNKEPQDNLSKNNIESIEVQKPIFEINPNNTALETVETQLPIQKINENNNSSNNASDFIPENRNNNGSIINNQISNPPIQKTPELIPPVVNKKRKGFYGIVALKRKTNALFLNLERITKLPFFQNKKRPQLHAAATLWLNFWDNPSITGFYGKQHVSNQFTNAFETIKSDKSDFGKIDFIQPLQNIAGYEHRFGKSGFAIGAYHKYLLKKNWNYNDISVSTSYNTNIASQLNVRIGASAIFHREQLAVNRLTLRERALYGDYIFSSDLDEFQARTEEYISYNVGGFINHPNFFLGYTAENVHQTFTNKTEEEFTTKHFAIAGAHVTILNHLKASAMLKFEKKLINTYSPSVGLTFKNKYVLVGEYNKLSRYDLSLGYNWNQRLRVLGTFGIKQIDDEDYQLNLDHYQERKGYVSIGAYYTFK